MNAALTLSAFNLACSGPSWTLGPKDLPVPEKAIQVHRELRIDLDAGRWCDGECTTTSPIARAQKRVLVLNEPADADRQGESYTEEWVDRESGLLTLRVKIMGALYLQTLRCEKAAFTGHPQLKF